MMGATISAESHESLYGGLIPTPNRHGGYRRVGIDLVIGFFSRNGNGDGLPIRSEILQRETHTAVAAP